MSSVAKVQSMTKYEHSPHIFSRRRTLFPTGSSDSEDSDLGPMSPLSYDSINDLDEKYLSSNLKDNNEILTEEISTIGDYHILGVVEHNDEIYTPNNPKTCAHSETMSPLVLSPGGSKIMKFVSDCALDDSTCTASPSSTLKTPHDSSTFKPKLPKLVRKSILDSPNISNKRKLSPTSSAPNKQIKLDASSKVRTTLFPELDLSLPTNKFYSSTEDIMEEIRNRKKVLPQPSVNFSPRRKITVSKKRLGCINAGVRHKIRRPKKKKNVTLLRAAMNKSETQAINNYLEDLKQLKSNSKETSTNLIENKENYVPVEQPLKQIIMPPKININLSTNSAYNENLISKKRPISPTPDEPNPNKKFFKSSRTMKGVITVNKNIKVQVNHGKMVLLDKSKSKKSVRFHSDDFVTKEDSELPKANIDNILSSLDEDINQLQNFDNKIVLQAHNSVVASENSILLHHEPSRNTNLILSPISQMCDFTSGLALNSPKRAKNLTSILDKMSSNSVNSRSSEENKLFSIFCNPSTGITPKKESRTLTTADRKFRKISEDQMLLDAGQKRFGATQCTECQFIYHMGDPSDETMHISYHEATHLLRFSGWKNERIVGDFSTKGRVIKILPTDSKLWWKRVTDLMELINRDLGYYEMEFKLNECQVFLYIKNRTIVGCIVAVARTEGYKMLTSTEHQPDFCSEQNFPIKCGISRIWVSHNYRKQGIGSAMMDVLKKNFLYGSVLTNSDIALSPPTEMGKEFAKNYFKSPNYLVYFL